MSNLKRLAVIAVLLASTSTAVQASPASSPAPVPCSGPQFHQFDFWIGHWDVFPTGTDRMVAHSVIESLYLGCAIRENWSPLRAGGDGGSLSGWSGRVSGWRQTWIGGDGAWVDFRGGLSGSAMVLQGVWPGSLPDGGDGVVRMTYSPAADGSVRQLGEISADGGKTWGPSFDFTYRPSKP